MDCVMASSNNNFSSSNNCTMQQRKAAVYQAAKAERDALVRVIESKLSMSKALSQNLLPTFELPLLRYVAVGRSQDELASMLAGISNTQELFRRFKRLFFFGFVCLFFHRRRM